MHGEGAAEGESPETDYVHARLPRGEISRPIFFERLSIVQTPEQETFTQVGN